jgi:GT2 family glycosyltransferase
MVGKMDKSINIYAVTVTYSDRYNFLEKTVNGAFKAGASKVIIVDNASTIDSKKNMDLLSKKDKRIKIIRFSKNKGSAGGFKKGLEYARKQEDCNFIWLLDDDNVPKKNALTVLKNYWMKSNIQNKKEKLALNSLRYYDYGFLLKTKKELELKNVEKDILMLNSFCYFSIDKMFSLIKRMFHRTRKKNNKTSYEMVNGAYGGLFMHKEVLKNGLPDENLFVYFDDIEFTYRLHNNGVRIFLIPDSKIDDVDRTLTNSEVKTYFSLFKILENIHTMNTIKLHYGYRNRVILEKQALIKNKTKYKINKLIFLLIIYPCLYLIYFLRYGKVTNVRLIKKAIKEGLNY